MNTFKRFAKPILYILLFIFAFLGGRAEGWYEADRFMQRLADFLSKVAPPPCG